MDGGSENMGLMESLSQRYKIKQTNISAYHPESNSLVERGHAPVVNSIAKFCKQRNEDDWTQISFACVLGRSDLNSAFYEIFCF